MMQTLLQATTLLGEHRDGWWPLWPLLWLAVLVGVVWFLSRQWRKPHGGGLDRAKEILAERFARGELSSEEYRQRLAELSD
jgi:putative membrane protein